MANVHARTHDLEGPAGELEIVRQALEIVDRWDFEYRTNPAFRHQVGMSAINARYEQARIYLDTKYHTYQTNIEPGYLTPEQEVDQAAFVMYCNGM